MKGNSFEHDAAYTAVRICITSEDQPPSIGTGFFYLADVICKDKVNRYLLLLVSNKHVFRHGRGGISLTLNRKDINGHADHGNTIPFTFDKFANRYRPHPEASVDLACVEVSYLIQTDAYCSHITKEFLAPIDYTKVALGHDVLFAGYPNDRYDVKNNLPLVRKGALASMPNIDFNGKGEIVIDAQVFPGSSGSPVFVSFDNNYRLLGVISKTMTTDNDEKQILGLGIIIKQRHVKELIDNAVTEIQKQIDDEITKMQNIKGGLHSTSPPKDTGR